MRVMYLFPPLFHSADLEIEHHFLYFTPSSPSNQRKIQYRQTYMYIDIKIEKERDGCASTGNGQNTPLMKKTLSGRHF